MKINIPPPVPDAVMHVPSSVTHVRSNALRQGDTVLYREAEGITWPAIVTAIAEDDPTIICACVLMTEGFLFQVDIHHSSDGITENTWDYRD